MYNFEQNIRFSKTLDGQALYSQGDMQLTHGERAETLTAVAITEGFFPTLGAPLAMGRNFAHEEMVGSARVVILSNPFWRNRLNGDPAILGRTLRLNRENWTVVGIAREGFEHVGGDFRSPLQGDTVSVWRPLPMDLPASCYRNCHMTNAVVRLKPGISFEGATQELNRILAGMAHDFPGSYANRTARLEPLVQEVAGQSRTTVLVLSTAGGCVLLLAAVNIAGLSIARTLARRHELAVRAALGGGMGRVIRAVLAENAVLGAWAGVAGLAIAAALLPVLRTFLPPEFPRAHEIRFGWPVAAFGAMSAVTSSLAAGLTAALRYARQDPAEALRDSSRSSSPGRSGTRLRGALVAAQLGMAFVLCFTAVLLLRSSLALTKRDPGFATKGVLVFDISLPDKVYDERRLAQFYTESRNRLLEIPGVIQAGFATDIPWTGYAENTNLEIPGFTPRPGESASARYHGASPGYFEALGTPLLSGRQIDAHDTARPPGEPGSVVINQALARRYFANRNPVGRALSSRWTIVGVIADVSDHPADAAVPAYWMALEQRPFGTLRAVMRTAGDALSLVSAIRAVITSLDPELAVANVVTMESIAKNALAERRFTLWWSGAFAALGLLLGAVGVYSLLAYSVQQRHREIGVRLALGASRRQVLGTLLARGATPAGAGVAAGLIVSPAAGRTLESLLYGMTPGDPAALGVAAGSILLAAILASLGPAWTAARTNPISALRET
jgi:predicted permease